MALGRRSPFPEGGLKVFGFVPHQSSEACLTLEWLLLAHDPQIA